MRDSGTMWLGVGDWGGGRGAVDYIFRADFSKVFVVLVVARTYHRARNIRRPRTRESGAVLCRKGRCRSRWLIINLERRDDSRVYNNMRETVCVGWWGRSGGEEGEKKNVKIKRVNATWKCTVGPAAAAASRAPSPKSSVFDVRTHTTYKTPHRRRSATRNCHNLFAPGPNCNDTMCFNDD